MFPLHPSSRSSKTLLSSERLRRKRDNFAGATKLSSVRRLRRVKSTVFVGEKEVARILTPKTSIELARKAYIKRAKGRVLEPLRTWFTAPGGAAFYFMPAHVEGSRTVSVKVVSVNPRNRRHHLPVTSATIHVFDAKTGSERARIAGENLTAIRTAASSAVATDTLARGESDVLGIIGTGKQAEAHPPVMLEVRDSSRILVYSRSQAHRKLFLKKARREIGVPIEATNSAEDVARKADILVVATSSRVPLFRGEIVSPGTHVNAIGASLPDRRELDTNLVRRSMVVVDSREQAFATYGEILIPIREGAIPRSHVRAELGEILLDPASLRRGENSITLFKSGGLAALDAIFADYVLSHTFLG